MSDPQRFRVADIQAQMTLGGQIMEVHPDGPYVAYSDYARLAFKSGCQAEGLNAFDNKLREAEAENARLKAEVERLRFAEDLLKDENQHLHKEQPLPDGWNSAVAKACDLLAEKEKENARLKAEVERLTKAGDVMHRAIKVSDPILDLKIKLWNAAKEGSQP